MYGSCAFRIMYDVYSKFYGTEEDFTCEWFGRERPIFWKTVKKSWVSDLLSIACKNTLGAKYYYSGPWVRVI